MPEDSEEPAMSYNLYQIGKQLGMENEQIDLPSIMAKIQTMQHALRDAAERVERWLVDIPRDIQKPISRPLKKVRETDIAAVLTYRRMGSQY